MSDSDSGGGGGGSCLGCILTIFVLWALLFGVSWGGSHYNVGCSCDRGVAIEESQP
jgi:hypothetical protein